jgi:hypothetical protein
MSSVLDSPRHERIEGLLYGLHCWEDPGQRKVFLATMLRGHPIWLDLRYGGSQREAAESLLALCGAPDAKLLHGRPPLCALLQVLRAEYGQNPPQLAEIDQLAAGLCMQSRQRERAVWEGAPYRGLSFFDRRHAPIFFGREAELQRLVDALGSEQGRRFLMIVGASGSGKSSLVRAGLWARLAYGDIPGEVFHGSAGWLVSVMTPSDAATPLAALVEATRHAVQERDGFEDLHGLDWPGLAADLEQGQRSLAELAGQWLASHPAARWLLILDQMEELFTAIDPDARETFIEQLIDATKPGADGRPPRVQVIATVRADFFHYCVAHPSLRAIIERGATFPLGAPDRLSLERMVSGPLTEVDLVERDPHGNRVPARWTLDPALAPKVSADAAERDGGLALMAFALRELYDDCQRQRQQRLSLEAYQSEAFGGLGGAVSRRANATLTALGEGAKDTLTRVFAHLVHVSEDQGATRRRVPLATWERDPEAQRLIDAFVQARLLVADRDARDGAILAVAHEALLREWPRLAEWIGDYGEALRLRDRVREETRIWVAQDRPAIRLWKHELLDPARRLLAGASLLDDLKREPDSADFLTPEADWLLAELLCADTDHARREVIGMRLSAIGDLRPGIGVVNGVPDILWCEIPAGAVEIEGHGRFEVSPFRIAAYPVTYAQYRGFLEAKDGFRARRWWKKLECEDPPGQQLRPYASYPADNVSWYDATAFCRWYSHRLGYEVRLPDEWEWQWAAQSAREGAVYPWGEDWLDGVANTYESGIGRTTAVGMYPGGRSHQGVYDLTGNVQEWCRGEGGNPKRTQPSGDGSRVLRGGSWDDNQGGARAGNRNYSHPVNRNHDGGFRVLCASPIR